MVVQIGSKPDSGFDDPLGMLRDCHRRIERFLGVLSRVAVRAEDRPLTSEDAAAVQAALDYFRSAGQRHNADEEESLFPRLRSAAPELAAVVHLEQEHREAEQVHASIEGLFSEWIATGTLSAGNRAALRAGTERLQRLYAEHIEFEETSIFPQAAQLLDRDTLAAMGQEFRARRQ